MAEFTAAELIGGGASAFGALSEVGTSRIQRDALLSQADETEFSADIERVNAKAQANNMRQALADTLANNSAALSTMGVDPGTGSPLVVQQQSIANANRAINDIAANATINENRLRRRAAVLRKTAKKVTESAESRAKLGLFTTFLSMGATGAA